MELLLRGTPAGRGLAVGRVAVGVEAAVSPGAEQHSAIVLVAGTGSACLRCLVAAIDAGLQVCGLVVERGGSLSSTGIVARELGLPAVVGATNALSRVREGELVFVDGGAGEVYRLDDDSDGAESNASPKLPIGMPTELDPYSPRRDS